MKVEITYPSASTRRYLRQQKRLLMVKWLLALSVCACIITNICVGGKAWSPVVFVSAYMVWTLVFSPDLVEYNRISQFIKLITGTCILLILIDRCLAPGWAITVVPIVCFSGLVIAGILFFTDLERQRQNMQPMLLLILTAMAGSVIGMSMWHGKGRWALLVMGVVAASLLALCGIVLGGSLFREFKRRFHVK